MQEIKQSTEIKVRIGAAVDATDGVTPETTLALGTADQVELLKHNGVATVDISGRTFAAVASCGGWYDLTLTTADTNTLGMLTVVIQDSSLMAPIFKDFMVTTANYWDSKYSTDTRQVDLTQMGGVTQSATDLKDFADTGYDPATHYTFGVTTCTTTTTNTDMVGTDSAALAATALSDVTWTDAKAVFLDHAISTVDTVCDTIAVDVAGINGEAMRGTDSAALATGVDVTSIHGSALTETVGGYLAAAFTKLFDVATPVLVASEVMRGTDGANTTTPDVAGTAATLHGTTDGLITTVDGIVDDILTDTGTTLPARFTGVEGATFATATDSLEAIRDQGDSAWITATGFSTHSAANVWTVAARTLTANTNFNDLDAAAVKAEAVAALADIKLDHLVNIAVDTNWATTVHLDSVIGHIADVGTAATFSRTTDALEAIRNRGDAEWVTAATTALSVQGKLDVNAECDSALSDYGANTTVPDIAGTAATLHSTTDGLVTTVDGVVDTILVDTNDLQTNQGDWLTATSVTVSDKTGFSLSSAGIDAILDEVIEGTHTLRQYIRTFAAVLLAKVSGGGTDTIVYRDVDDSKDRVTATVTEDGNRTTVVLVED